MTSARCAIRSAATGTSLHTLVLFSRTSDLGPSYLVQLANRRPRQAIPERLRALNCQDSPVNDLAAAAIRAGDDLQPVTVGVVEVQAAAAVVVVDRPGPAFAGIRPVRQPPVPDAAEGGVELVLAHEERVVLGDDLSAGLGEVQRDGVVGLDHEKMPEPGGRRQAENLAQEGCRPLLVTAGDYGVVQ